MLEVRPPTGGLPISPEPVQEKLPAVMPPSRQLVLWQPQKRGMGHRTLLVGVLLLFLLLVGSAALVVDLNGTASPSARVTITPQYSDMQQIATVSTRSIRFSSSIAQGATVPTSGTTQQSAERASGKLTFFNIATFPQNIPAGTAITGKDGVTVITDSSATVQAGNPPMEASVNIPAHARASGPAGNIPANDIYLAPCCANITINGVVVNNSSPFSGGQDAEHYSVVNQSDIDTASVSVTAILLPKAQGALREQERPGLQQYAAPQCTASTQASPPVGHRAKQVVVTVTESCHEVVYDLHAVVKTAIDQFTANSLKRSMAGYRLLSPKARITTISLHDPNSGMLSCVVLVEGRWLFQFDPATLAHLKQQLAGLSDVQAQTLLQKEGGVRQDTIHISSGNMFPSDINRITLLLVPAP